MFYTSFKSWILLASTILNIEAIVFLVNNKTLIKSYFFIVTYKEIVKASN